MDEIIQEIKESENYQLLSLIEQFERFKKESVVNTTTSIIKMVLSEAKKELEIRNNT